MNLQPTELADGGPVASGARQFVIFSVDGESFGVALSEVKEIIRVPDVVRLPLGPPCLEGLANLRGSVLPIVSTRRLFGATEVPRDDATRVVVLDHSQPIGIIVDRMASVVTVDAAQIEDASAVGRAAGTDAVSGMIKNLDGHGVVMILDGRRLIEGEIASATGAGAATKRTIDLAADGPGAGSAARESGSAGEGGRDERQLVSFEVAGQEYAFPIGSVQEIVQVPASITRLPKVASSVIGLMTLRNRLLPLVSLRGLFRLEPVPLAEHNRVVVVTVGGAGVDPAQAGSISVGVVVDRVNEVVRVSQSGIDAMPPLLAADPALSDITSICRLDGGARIISILSAEAMFDRPELEAAIEAGQGPGGSADDQDAAEGAAGPDRTTSVDEEQFVVFRLQEAEYGVGIGAVQEIVRLPEGIAHVPRTPSWLRGVVNLRGAVIPLIDQRARFGLPAAERNDRQRIMVFTVQGVRTGFIVDSVSEVMRIPSARIGLAPEMSEAQRRVVGRVANLEAEGRMILLLDSEALLDQGEAQGVARPAA